MIMITFFVLLFVMVDAVQRSGPSTPLNPLDRLVTITSHSDHGCVENMLKFLINNQKYCIGGDGSTRVDTVTSNSAKLCHKDDPSCEAKYKCTVHHDYQNCPKEYLQRGLTASFGMFCFEGMYTWIEGDYPNSEVRCLDRYEFNAKMDALRRTNAQHMHDELKLRLRSYDVLGIMESAFLSASLSSYTP